MPNKRPIQDEITPNTEKHLSKPAITNSYLNRVFNATTAKTESSSINPKEESTKKLVQFKEPSRSELEALVEDQPQSTQFTKTNLRTGNALFKTLTRTSE